VQIYYLKKPSLTKLLVGLVIVGIWLWAIFAAKSSTAMKEEPIYQGSEESKYVSFAINVDWGEEYLPEMVNIFKEHEVKSTFFLTGRWTDNNQELARQIAASGHEIGNHAYSHASPNALSEAENREEIKKTADAIKEATGITTNLYAPPSGERKDHVLAAATAEGYWTILWNVDTIDWQKPSVDTIIQRVVSKVKGGSIVLMHPTANTVAALPAIISELQNQGYMLVPVSVNAGLEVAAD